jgi:hypothetical protein
VSALKVEDVLRSLPESLVTAAAMKQQQREEEDGTVAGKYPYSTLIAPL